MSAPTIAHSCADESVVTYCDEHAADCTACAECGRMTCADDGGRPMTATVRPAAATLTMTADDAADLARRAMTAAADLAAAAETVAAGDWAPADLASALATMDARRRALATLADDLAGAARAAGFHLAELRAAAGGPLEFGQDRWHGGAFAGVAR